MSYGTNVEVLFFGELQTDHGGKGTLLNASGSFFFLPCHKLPQVKLVPPVCEVLVAKKHMLVLLCLRSGATDYSLNFDTTL